MGRKGAVLHLTLVLVGTAMVAYMRPRSAGPLPSTVVPIADFKTVAGTWEGVLHGMPGSEPEGDCVGMTIGEDGTYAFISYRAIGVFSGNGTLSLSQGKLVVESARGRATFTLYEGEGRRLLRAEAVTSAGRSLTAALSSKP